MRALSIGICLVLVATVGPSAEAGILDFVGDAAKGATNVAIGKKVYDTVFGPDGLFRERVTRERLTPTDFQVSSEENAMENPSETFYRQLALREHPADRLGTVAPQEHPVLSSANFAIQRLGGKEARLELALVEPEQYLFRLLICDADGCSQQVGRGQADYDNGVLQLKGLGSAKAFTRPRTAVWAEHPEQGRFTLSGNAKELAVAVTLDLPGWERETVKIARRGSPEAPLAWLKDFEKERQAYWNYRVDKTMKAAHRLNQAAFGKAQSRYYDYLRRTRQTGPQDGSEYFRPPVESEFKPVLASSSAAHRERANRAIFSEYFDDAIVTHADEYPKSPAGQPVDEIRVVPPRSRWNTAE